MASREIAACTAIGCLIGLTTTAVIGYALLLMGGPLLRNIVD